MCRASASVILVFYHCQCQWHWESATGSQCHWQSMPLAVAVARSRRWHCQWATASLTRSALAAGGFTGKFKFTASGNFKFRRRVTCTVPSDSDAGDGSITDHWLGHDTLRLELRVCTGTGSGSESESDSQDPSGYCPPGLRFTPASDAEAPSGSEDSDDSDAAGATAPTGGAGGGLPGAADEAAAPPSTRAFFVTLGCQPAPSALNGASDTHGLISGPAPPAPLLLALAPPPPPPLP